MRAAFLIFIVCLGSLYESTWAQKFDYGFALQFDGSNDFVAIPPSIALIGGPTTVQAWVRPTDSGHPGCVFQLGLDTNTDVVRFHYSAGKIYFVVSTGTTTSTLSADIQTNRWTMVTGVVRPNSVAELYLDAQLVASATSFSMPRALTRTVNYIGVDSNARYFAGFIDEVLVYGVDLPASSISTRSVVTGNDTSVLYYWNFDQGIGFVAEDLGSTATDGALGGGNIIKMPYWVVPVKVASKECTSWGDPHVTTFDGLYYHPMNVGTFWVLRSFDNALSMQNMQDRWIQNSNAAVNIGFALRAYGDTVSIDLNFRAHPGQVFVHVNGQDRTGENSLYLPNSGIVIARVDGNGYFYFEIDVPFMYTMKFISYTSSGTYYTNLWLRMFRDYRGPNVGGQCGNWDDDTTNDFTDPITGTIYPSATWQNWQDYVSHLAVPWADSYFNDNNVFVPFVPVSTIVFQDPQLEAVAHSICDNTAVVAARYQWSCLYDIAVTGDIGLATPAAQATYQQCLTSIAGTANINANTVCPKPCPNFCSMSGTCTAGVCHCNAGRTGLDCSVQKQYWCYEATWDLDSLQPQSVSITPIKNRQSVVDWYSYNTQHPASANTGYEIVNSTILLLHNQFYGVDNPNSDVSFVLINDKYDDGSGGTMSIEAAITDANGNPLSGVYAPVFDDPGDDLSWNNVTGTGVFNWLWWPCCTDGLALGPISASAPWKLHLDIDFSEVTGIDQIFVGSRAQTGGLDLFKIETSLATSGIDISGGWCFDPCGDQNNCTSCLDQVECGWCNDAGVCQAGTATGPARGRCKNWRYSKDPSVSRVVNFETGYPMDPSYYQVFLASNDPLDAHVYVNLPTYNNLPVDVLIIQDLSYNNFNPYLDFLESIYRSVFLATTAIYPWARFALGTFMDKPVMPYGNPSRGDYVYATNVYLTNNPQMMQGGISRLVIGDGQDAPGSQMEALLQVSQRVDQIGYSNGKRIAVVVTKGTFHTPVGGSFVPNNLDGVIDANEDYPDPADVRNQLLLNNIVPVFVVTPDIVDTYRDLVNTWGFGYVSLMASSIENMGAQILEGINFVVNSAYLTPINRGFIDSWRPQIYRGMSPGVRVNFDVRLEKSAQTTASLAAPGSGILNMESTSDDLPKTTSVDTYTLYEDSYIVASLTGTSVYTKQLTAIITVLPTKGTLYQYIGATRGAAITNTGTAIQSPLGEVWYEPVQYGHSIPAGSIYDKLSYKVLDDCEACSVSTQVNFIVIHVNHPPVANGITDYTTLENTPVVLSLTGTDVDVEDTVTAFVTLPQPGSGKLFQYLEGDLVGAELVGDASNASQVNDAQGRVWFVPDPFRFGSPYASFPYWVSDGIATSNSLIVSVYVTEVNYPPTATSYTTTTTEDIAVSLVLAGTDPDQDVLTSTITGLPARGSLYQNDNGTLGVSITIEGTVVTDPNGIVWYVPSANLHMPPTDTVTFNVSDPGVPAPMYTAAGVVSIDVTPVNDAPVALPSNATGFEDQEVVITLNGWDVDTTTGDGDMLSAVICTYPALGSLYQYPGHEYIDPSAPDANENGWFVTDAGNRVIYAAPLYGNCGDCVEPYTWFLFRMADRPVGDANRLESGCANATLSLIHVNHPPTATTSTPIQGIENNDTVITLMAGDVDRDLLVNFRITAIPTRGTLYQAIDLGGGNFVADTNAVITAGTNVTAITAISATTWNGFVVYRPVTFGNGKNYASLTFVSNDNQVDSPSFTAIIDVKFVNQVPFPTPIADKVILEDTFLVFEVNGTDIELSPLTGLMVLVSPDISTYGSFFQVGINGAIDASSPISFPSDGSPVTITSPDKLVGFVPAPNMNDRLVPWSPAPFSTVFFAVTDGNATSGPLSFHISVTPVNDPPVATASTQFTIYEGGSGIIGLTGSDPDLPFDSLTSVVTVLPTRGSLFQSDINTQPTVAITSADTDVTDFMARVFYVPPNADVCSTPAGAPYDSFTYHVRDLAGALSQELTISVTIICINEAPVANHLDILTSENAPVIITLTAYDEETPLSLEYNVTGTYRGTLYLYSETTSTHMGTAIPTGLVVPVGPSNKVVYSPAPNDFSPSGTIYESFNYWVTDGELYDTTGSVSIYVNLVPHPPVANGGPVTLNEDTQANLYCTGFSPDFPNAVLLSVLITLPAHGTVTTSTGGAISIGDTFSNYLIYTPSFHYRGTDSIVYQVYDGINYSASYTLPITVLPVNHRPLAVMPGHLVGPQDSVVGPVALSGTDEDNDVPLTAYVATLPTRGDLFQVNADGSVGAKITIPGRVTNANNLIVYLQNAANSGINAYNFDRFTFQIDDNTGTANSLSTPATAVIDLLPVNLPPTAYFLNTPIGNEDSLISVTVFGNTGDAGTGITQNLTATITSLPAKGVLYQADGSTVVAQGGSVVNFATNDNVIYAFSLTFLPALNEYSVDVNTAYTTFSFQVTDSFGATSEVVTVPIIVRFINDPPTPVYSANYTTLEDTPLDFIIDATDIENDAVSVVVTGLGDPDLCAFFSNGVQLSLNSTIPAPANLTFVPAPDAVPVCTFRFSVVDTPGPYVQYSIYFYVTAVNDAPVINFLHYEGGQNSTGAGTVSNPYRVTGTTFVAYFNCSDIDADQNYVTGSVVASPAASTSISLLNSLNDSPDFIVNTIEYVNNAIARVQVTFIGTRPSNGRQAITLTVSVNDNGFVGIGGSKTTTLSAVFGLTIPASSGSSNVAPATGGAVAGLGAAVAGVFGAYKWLKKKSLIDDADPWESDAQFDTTMDNPLYNTQGQNFNALYDGTTAPTPN